MLRRRRKLAASGRHADGQGLRMMADDQEAARDWAVIVLQCLRRSTCGLAATTSASHAEGRQLDPGQVCQLAVISQAVPRKEQEKETRLPGVEPGAQAREACMLPLHYRRSCKHLVKTL